MKHDNFIRTSLRSWIHDKFQKVPCYNLHFLSLMSWVCNSKIIKKHDFSLSKRRHSTSCQFEGSKLFIYWALPFWLWLFRCWFEWRYDQEMLSFKRLVKYCKLAKKTNDFYINVLAIRWIMNWYNHEVCSSIWNLKLILCIFYKSRLQHSSTMKNLIISISIPKNYYNQFKLQSQSVLNLRKWDYCLNAAVVLGKLGKF